MEQQYILKRRWQSKTGIQEELYLGYNNSNKLDYITDLPRAKVMTKEECNKWLLVLANSNQIVIDVLPEDFDKEEIRNIEENTNEQSTDN